MKVWVVWAEAYGENIQDIWTICGSKEEAEQCITNAHEQVRHDEERWNELITIASEYNCLTDENEREMDKIGTRKELVLWSGGTYILPFFSIREYDVSMKQVSILGDL